MERILETLVLKFLVKFIFSFKSLYFSYNFSLILTKLGTHM